MIPSAKLYALLAASLFSLASSASLTQSHLIKFEKRAPTYPAPNVTPPQSSLPQEWIAALNSAVAAGKIPNIPATTLQADGSNPYPGAYQQSYCSWTANKCNGPDDITDAPDGEWSVAFDDGPTAASTELYDFLQQNNQPGTHFMIGSQILAYQQVFQHAIATNQEVALHTWSHHLLTTLDNFGIVAELGWNMQIIYDLSGRVPVLYRPPQGDLDARVRAIAKELFNLTAVMWNDECNDWCIQPNGQSACPGRQPGTTIASVEGAIQASMNKPKSPGVSLLEHELNSYQVGFFKNYYPQLAGKGWKPQAVSDHYGRNWYANARGNFDSPLNASSMLIGSNAAAVAPNGTTSSTTTSSRTATTIPTVVLTTGTASRPVSTAGVTAAKTSGSSKTTYSLLALTVSAALSTFFITL